MLQADFCVSTSTYFCAGTEYSPLYMSSVWDMLSEWCQLMGAPLQSTERVLAQKSSLQTEACMHLLLRVINSGVSVSIPSDNVQVWESHPGTCCIESILCCSRDEQNPTGTECQARLPSLLPHRQFFCVHSSHLPLGLLKITWIHKDFNWQVGFI